MTLGPVWQTWIFGGMAVFMIALNVIMQPDLIGQLIMLVPAVALLGLPHGALDLAVAQALWPLNGWRGLACFVGLYIGIALGVIGIWTVLPAVSLFAFLIYSAVHFSGDWDDAVPFIRYTGGVATIGAPALFWQHDVATLFAFLAPVPAAQAAALVLAIAGGAALALSIAAVVLRPDLRTTATIEQGVIWISAACLSPLVYFVVYFCTLHSVRHFADALGALDNRGYALRVAGGLSVITVLAGLAAFAILQRVDTPMVAQSVLQIVFIGVAALTVPHMILVDRFQKQKRTPTAR